MKQTKESLLIEVVKLRDSHAGWVSGDEVRRKEFAKAFRWSNKGSQSIAYNSFRNIEPEITNPSWTEIFVEIGKLLARQKQLTYITDVEELKLNVRANALEIENLIQNGKHI